MDVLLWVLLSSVDPRSFVFRALHQNLYAPLQGRGRWDEGGDGRGRDTRMLCDADTVVRAREAQAQRVSGLGSQRLCSTIEEY